MFWFLRMRIALVGLLLLIAAGGAFVTSIKKQSSGVEATATLLSRIDTCQLVMRVDSRTVRPVKDVDCRVADSLASPGDQLYTLTHSRQVKLRFDDAGGKTHWVTADASVAPAATQPGEEFSIYYDPANPETVRTPGGVGSLVGLILIGLFGLVVVSAALKFNPLRLLAVAGGAGARIAASGRTAEGRSKWQDSADEAIARALQPAPAPASQTASASSYGAAPARTFGRRHG